MTTTSKKTARKAPAKATTKPVPKPAASRPVSKTVATTPSRVSASAPTKPAAAAKITEAGKPFHETWTFLIIICITLPILFRSFVYAPFHIPSGSMKPTLLIGDFLFVSKHSYGYSRYSFPLGIKLYDGRKGGALPKRGDILVFRPPLEVRTDFIKRLIGLPGDRVQVKHGELYINGVIAPRKRIEDFRDEDEDGTAHSIPRYIETLPNGVTHEVLDDVSEGEADNTEEFTVPDGKYFVMGDNRDHSMDSRFREVRFIPAENLVGRAEVIFISTKGSLWKLWQWPYTLRTERIFQPLPEGK